MNRWMFLIILVVLIFWGLVIMNEKKAGTLILLNGTSSSGKSAIINEFKEIDSDYKVYKVDDYFPKEVAEIAQELGWNKESGIDPWVFLHDYIARKTGAPVFDTELRKELFSDVPSFYNDIKKDLDHGNNVILDIVLENESDFANFDTFFTSNKVYKVLVYCPLDILLQRVQTRNKMGVKEEKRTAFLSFEQFPTIYKTQENDNEQVVDHVKTNILKQALKTAIQELIDNKVPEAYLPKLKKFEEKFIQRFKLDAQAEITLVARQNYDLIVNSGINSPEQLARQIAAFEKKK